MGSYDDQGVGDLEFSFCHNGNLTLFMIGVYLIILSLKDEYPISNKEFPMIKEGSRCALLSYFSVHYWIFRFLSSVSSLDSK